jgi:hypothetical protein
VNSRLSLERINALASDPARCARMDGPHVIDASRPFVHEHHTQLYFTPVYATLTHEQRLHYNQLFALRVNEYIMMLEADLIDRLLLPLSRCPGVRGDPALLQALQTMAAEERRHFAGFAGLNRACRPDLYPPGRDRHFSLLPAWTRAMFGVVGLLTPRFAFALWYLMAMEESAKSLAREMSQNRRTETLGELDPGFVALHFEHLKDETRHVHVDALLVERCLDPRHARANARLFMAMLGGVVRPTRGGSGVKVVRRLVRERPELAPREGEMIDAVLALADDRRFQRSLFNRGIMPRTFEVFDRTPALARLGEKMVGYDRCEVA